MNCWACNTKLIWGGDHDCECMDHDSFIESSECSCGYPIITNLHCPSCNSLVMFYHSLDKPKGDGLF